MDEKESNCKKTKYQIQPLKGNQQKLLNSQILSRKCLQVIAIRLMVPMWPLCH